MEVRRHGRLLEMADRCSTAGAYLVPVISLIVHFDSIPVILEHRGGQFSRAGFALGNCSKEVQILQFEIDDPPSLRDEVH